MPSKEQYRENCYGHDNEPHRFVSEELQIKHPSGTVPAKVTFCAECGWVKHNLREDLREPVKAAVEDWLMAVEEDAQSIALTEDGRD